MNALYMYIVHAGGGDLPPGHVLNETRILSQHPPQPFTMSSMFQQDPESVCSSTTIESSRNATFGTSDPTPSDSVRHSLQGSQTSLTSFKPDVLVSGSQKDIAFRMKDQYQKLHLQALTVPPRAAPPDGQSVIDVHASPDGQIAIASTRGSLVQNDLSQHQISPSRLSGGSAQRPPLTGLRGPLQFGSPPSVGGSGCVQATSLSPQQVPTSVSPKKGGTVTWGMPPGSTPGICTATSTTAQQTPSSFVPSPPTTTGAPGPPPPFVITTYPKPPQPPPPALPSGGINLSHSCSAPSLIKPPSSGGGSRPMPFFGEESAKNGLQVQSSFPSFKVGGGGGSTNPLGELKRSEPVGDLTQIRRGSAQQGSSPGDGRVVGDSLVTQKTSSVSVPNVAMTTKSDLPPSLGVGGKFTSSASSSSIAPFASTALPTSHKPATTGIPSSQPSVLLAAGPTVVSPQKPFTTGLGTLPSTSKTPSTAGPSMMSKSIFSFGAQGSQSASPQFNFSLGSSTAPSFGASHAKPSKSATTPTASHVTSIGPPTSSGQSSGGTGSIFSSMPEFNLSPRGGSSPFHFSPLSSFGISSAASPSTQAASKATTSSLTSGIKFPFSPQPPSSLLSTIAAVSAKTSPPSAPVISLSSSLKTTSGSEPQLPTSSITTTKPFSFTPPVGKSGFVFGDSTSLSSRFVFGDKSPNLGLFSGPGLMSKKSPDASKPLSGERGEEDVSENGSSGGSTGASGGEEESPIETTKPQEKDLLRTAGMTEASSVKPPLPAVQKLLPSEDVSKTIPQIVKPTVPRMVSGQSTTKEEDSVTDEDVVLKTGSGQEMAKTEQVTDEKKPLLPSQSASESGGVERKPLAELHKPSPPEDGGEEEVVSKVTEKVEKPKPDKTPHTATLPDLAQPPQATATPTPVSEVPIQPPKDSKKYEPPPPPPPTTAAGDGATKSGGEDKEKQPLFVKPAEKTDTTAPLATTPVGSLTSSATTTDPAAATGGQATAVGQEDSKMKGSGSQSSLLSLNIEDIQVAADTDMEGDMEGK